MAVAISVPTAIKNLLNPLGTTEAHAIESNPTLLKDIETGINPLAEEEASGLQDVGGVTGAAGDVAGIWGKLNDRATWIRIAEVALGAGLILVALAHMTGASKVADLAAKVVPK